ncbi:MAG TPA: hypothetical protein VIA19_11775 [Burkholderiales bacterium]
MGLPVPQAMDPAPSDGMVTLTHVLYALHGFSALMGVLSAAFIVTAFLTGWPSIIAVIVNYVKRRDARGTWLDSHYGWQLRTFWYALLWVVVAGLLFLTVIGIPFAFVLMIIAGLWVLYRIIRGWIALAEARPMPVPH